jgi:cardiolipin synthase (CMP-forming)
MLNVPNAITLLRFALVPVIALQIAQRHDGMAFALFVVSALSDLADGVVARHWKMRTRFGAIADPLADKLTMLTVAVLLALQGSLPLWFAAAIASRDVLIVIGVLGYRVLIGPLEMAPSMISKLNTVLEFLALLGALATRAQLVRSGPWLDALVLAALATICLSGAHYVAAGIRMAIRARRARDA